MAAEIAMRKSIIVSKYPNQYPACWVHVSDEVRNALLWLIVD